MKIQLLWEFLSGKSYHREKAGSLYIFYFFEEDLKEGCYNYFAFKGEILNLLGQGRPTAGKA